VSARSLLARLGLAFGLVGAMHGEAGAAQSVLFDKAPAAWVAYAKGATISITGWLNGDTPPAPRMREAMTKQQPQAGQLLPPMILSLWVAPTGTISKVKAKSDGNAQADADFAHRAPGPKTGRPAQGHAPAYTAGCSAQRAQTEEGKAELNSTMLR
jgi:hypothetical protein